MHIAPHREPQRTTRRVLWAFSCTAVIGLGVVGWTVPMAQAHAERALRAGHELFSHLDPDLLGPAQALWLNGERLWLASTVTPRSVSSVLDEFEQRCQSLLKSRGVDSDGMGHLACVADAPEHASQSLLLRARDFAQSGDLSRLGDVLYVVARPDPTSSFTHVISVWTEGKFDLAAIFSSSGDAPGADSETVPRPPNSVRVLSANVVERPYALRLYTTRESPTSVLEYYEHELKRRGFDVFQTPKDTASRAFKKGAIGLIISTSQTASDCLCVSLLELSNPGYVGIKMTETP